MTKHRSFLKWAGSKYSCLNTIIDALPEGKRLIEPFTGTGVVSLNTNYAASLLAEKNNDLIELFTTLITRGEEFIIYCQSYFKPETNDESVYYQLRARFNELLPSEERSALFVYLNRHGYNGLCRYNSKGLFNVPFGRYKSPYFPHQEMRIFLQKNQRTTQFIYNDFRNTFALAERGDVIYCDPPYVPILEHTKPVAYTQNKFSNEDQIELAELARETAAKGIHVLISNHDTKFTREQYKSAKISSFQVARVINCKTDSRQPVKELIALF